MGGRGSSLLLSSPLAPLLVSSSSSTSMTGPRLPLEGGGGRGAAGRG
jgi:hypothetical protein